MRNSKDTCIKINCDCLGKGKPKSVSTYIFNQAAQLVTTAVMQASVIIGEQHVVTPLSLCRTQSSQARAECVAHIAHSEAAR